MQCSLSVCAVGRLLEAGNGPNFLGAAHIPLSATSPTNGMFRCFIVIPSYLMSSKHTCPKKTSEVILVILGNGPQNPVTPMRACLPAYHHMNAEVPQFVSLLTSWVRGGSSWKERPRRRGLVKIIGVKKNSKTLEKRRVLNLKW